jgi:cell division protein FtsL
MAVAIPARRQRATSRPAPRPRPARRPRARPAPRRRVAGGVVWIALVALLLVGIVALNVAALRLNLETQRLDERKERLLGENAATASELSALAAADRIESAARERLGLVQAAEVTYVRSRPGR